MVTSVDDDLAERYLELLKAALQRQPIVPSAGGRRRSLLARVARLADVVTVYRQAGGPRGPVAFGDARAMAALGDADTMIGRARLDQLHHAVRTVIREAVSGDLVETGVWRGGASILMRGALVAYGDETRNVWLADSFQGLPSPDPAQPLDADLDFSSAEYFAVSKDEVQRRFESYGLLDHRVRFLEGWFADTLPTAPVGSISILRLDGDLYSSTTDALVALYSRVSNGGFVVVDDYGTFEACRRAVDDFRAQYGVTDSIVRVDEQGVFWRKTSM